MYNKWHETELERWLSDHDIPYPTPADRKDLESLVEKNWDQYTVTPYKNWDTADLSAYLRERGKETKAEAEATKDNLLHQVEANWYESEENAQHAWESVKDWILDTWTESQLKAFADKHGIPGTFPTTLPPLASITSSLTLFLQSHSRANVILFSKKLARVTRMLLKSSAKPPPILEIGCTRPGLSPISRNGLIPMASLRRSPRLETDLLLPFAVTLALPISRHSHKPPVPPPAHKLRMRP